jgi:ATP phosphoribosyltransferase
MLIANKKSWQDPQKREKIENFNMMLQGAIKAEGKVGLKMNAPQVKLEDIMKELPAMKRPTISPLHGSEWVAVETIVEEHSVRNLIPRLKKAGAEDIIEYPLNKVIY